MGGFSKILATLMTYPFQVTKTRMQRERLAGDVEYTQTWSSFRKIARNEGVLGFYKGLGANLLRVAPSSAVIFAIYERTKSELLLLNGL